MITWDPIMKLFAIKLREIIATLAYASFLFYSTRYVLKEHRVGGK